jgi:hypothetical protein
MMCKGFHKKLSLEFGVWSYRAISGKVGVQRQVGFGGNNQGSRLEVRIKIVTRS